MVDPRDMSDSQLIKSLEYWEWRLADFEAGGYRGAGAFLKVTARLSAIADEIDRRGGQLVIDAYFDVDAFFDESE